MKAAPKSAVLGAIVLSTTVIAAAYVSALLPGGAPRWAAWAFALGIPCLLVAIMWLGVARAGRGLGRLAGPFAFVWVVLVLGFGTALVLPTVDSSPAGLWWGLPPGAAVVLYGIGLLPSLVLPLAYALTFDQLTLSESDLERVRAARDLLARANATESGPRTELDPDAEPVTTLGGR